MSVTTEEADGVEIITCWLPLVDVDSGMGALQIHPDLAGPRQLLQTTSAGNHSGARRRGGLIDEEVLPATPPLDAAGLRAGDLLLISAFTPHHSTRNRSDKVRWSMDLRFQPAGTASGRSQLPSFVVRSAGRPALEYSEWDAAWAAAEARAEA